MIRTVCTILLLTTGCIDKKQPRPPRCSAGVDAATGNCRAATTALSPHNPCVGDIQIKASGRSCLFQTANQADCHVKGIIAVQKMDGSCYVRDVNNQACEFNDVDLDKFICKQSIARQRAPVKVYLEVTKQGLVPKVIFEEQVEAGAELTIEDQNYAERDIVKKDNEQQGTTELTIPLRIPWKIDYRRQADKTRSCVRGYLEGRNTSREDASQGEYCL